MVRCFSPAIRYEAEDCIGQQVDKLHGKTVGNFEQETYRDIHLSALILQLRLTGNRELIGQDFQ